MSTQPPRTAPLSEPPADFDAKPCPCLANRLAAEAFGTFALVFAGCGAIVIDHASGGAVTHPGVAITFGLVVMAMIYAIGDVSGAHINPAVTIAFAAAGRFAWRHVGPYVAAQCVAALAAAAVLCLLFPSDPTLGATLPAGSALQSFTLEVLLTLLLMAVILNVTAAGESAAAFAGVAIGGVVGLEAMFAGPICGASMNPARSLGPAVVSGKFDALWVYLAAPTLGALLAVPVTWAIRSKARG